MDSIFSRVNIIFCSFVLSLALCAFGNFASSFFYETASLGSAELNSILDLGISPYLRNDQANIAIDIDTEFNKVFQWNTNQLFLFVYVSYYNHGMQNNLVTVWDNIVSAEKKNMDYSVKGVINKYPIRDVGRNLRDKSFKLNIAYCYMPILGRIHYRHLKETKNLKLPNKYFQYN